MEVLVAGIDSTSEGKAANEPNQAGLQNVQVCWLRFQQTQAQ